MILFVAVVELIPYAFAGAIVGLLAPIAGFSRILHTLSCAAIGTVLAFGWWVASRGSFDVIAQQLTLFSAAGFLISGAVVSQLLKRGAT